MNKNLLIFLVVLIVLLIGTFLWMGISKPNLRVTNDASSELSADVLPELSAGAGVVLPEPSAGVAVTPSLGLAVNGNWSDMPQSVKWQEVDGNDDERWDHFSKNIYRVDGGSLELEVDPADSTETLGQSRDLTILQLLGGNKTERISVQPLRDRTYGEIDVAAFRVTLPERGRYIIRDSYSGNQDSSAVIDYYWLIEWR